MDANTLAAVKEICSTVVGIVIFGGFLVFMFKLFTRE